MFMCWYIKTVLKLKRDVFQKFVLKSGTVEPGTHFDHSNINGGFSAGSQKSSLAISPLTLNEVQCICRSLTFLLLMETSSSLASTPNC